MDIKTNCEEDNASGSGCFRNQDQTGSNGLSSNSGFGFALDIGLSIITQRVGNSIGPLLLIFPLTLFLSSKLSALEDSLATNRLWVYEFAFCGGYNNV